MSENSGGSAAPAFDRLDPDADILSRLAVESWPTGVMAIGPDGTIKIVNRELARLFGYALEELIGQPVEMLLPVALRAVHAAHREAFQSACTARPMAGDRNPVGLRKDGSTLPVHVSLSPIYTETGVFVLAAVVDAATVRDQDDGRRRAHEEALAFERLIGDLTASFVAISPDRLDGAIVDALRGVVESLALDRASVFMISADGRDLTLSHYWSRPGLQRPVQQLSAASGYRWSLAKLLRGEEVCFSSLDEIEDPTERDNVQHYGTVSRVSFPLWIGGRVTGSINFASIRKQTWRPEVLDRLRLLAQVFGTALSRRQVETEACSSEQRFQVLADNATAMIWASGTDKRGAWFNRRWLEFVGRPLEHEIGHGWIDHVHPDDVDAWRRQYAACFDARQPFTREYRLRRDDGQWRWVLDNAAPNYDADGTFIGYLGSCVDVTEQKQAVHEVERLRERLHAENVYLRREVAERLGTGVIVGQSESIRNVLSQIEQVAHTDSTVLLLGETGTGKELFATRIHELSMRRGRTMVRVNCAAIPGTLIESELFGREKGAFTGALARQAGRFELADHSTIFLDEIGDLPQDVQVKLLRVLEERQLERLGSPRPIHIDVRIIAATHRNLEQRTVDGSFREDLFYRLNVFPIQVPPLRERVEDIPLLVWRFVEEFSRSFGKRVETISRENMTALQRYAWPGNVRELRNAVERAMIVTSGPRLRIGLPGTPVTSDASSVKLTDVEKAHIRSVLESTRWRIRGAGGAADRLGLRPTTLETRMAKLGLVRPRAS